MNLIIHFLRHGQTTLSRDDRFCGSGMDPHLTPEGLQMAEAFAVADEPVAWAAVYTSPLTRTLETAQPICAHLQLRAEVRPALREIAYGHWENLTKEEVAERFHDEYVAWLRNPAQHAPPEGELATTVAERALSVVQEIKERHTNGNVLVVSHKATIRIVLCSLLGIDVAGFRYRLACPVGSVSRVEFTNNGPMLLSIADRSHLNEKLKSLPGT